MLLKRLSSDVPTVIVFDEAQHLTSELLEEIRLLGNLERRSTKAAFVVLIAQTSLRERLQQPDLEASGAVLRIQGVGYVKYLYCRLSEVMRRACYACAEIFCEWFCATDRT